MALPALVAPGFWRHPKLFRLAAALEQPKVMVGGSLVALWGWCHEYRPTGSLEGLSDAEIAAAAEWPLEPSRYVAALRFCGWLDSLEVHDFAVRQGKKAILNAQAATRMANKRERDRNDSVTETKNSVTPLPLPLPLPDPLPEPKPSLEESAPASEVGMSPNVDAVHIAKRWYGLAPKGTCALTKASHQFARGLMVGIDKHALMRAAQENPGRLPHEIVDALKPKMTQKGKIEPRNSYEEAVRKAAGG